MRTPVKCIEIPEVELSNLKASGDSDYVIVSVDGVWTSITATTGSESITGSTEQSFTITNGGIIECEPTFTFTPTAAETSFQVSTTEEFKFRLDGTFAAGVAINYDMSNGKLTIGSAEVNVTNYLIDGSPFPLEVGDNTVYVKCSGAGTFSYSFYKRWV